MPSFPSCTARPMRRCARPTMPSCIRPRRPTPRNRTAFFPIATSRPPDAPADSSDGRKRAVQRQEAARVGGLLHAQNRLALAAAIAHGVLHVARDLVRLAFGLVELAFGLQLLVAGQLAGRLLDGALG